MIEALITIGVVALIALGLWANARWANTQADADARDLLDWWKDTHA